MNWKKQQDYEVSKYHLAENKAYLDSYLQYSDSLKRYKTRCGSTPCGVPEKHMLKALRIAPWLNTPSDWARLHVYEMAMKTRTRFN